MTVTGGDVIPYIRANRDRYLAELTEWIACPSISADPAFAADVRRSAETAVARMRAAGLTEALVLETDGHPVAYGSWLHAPGAPTILIYGHHDVQPVDPLELWKSPPFAADVREGKIFGRGSVDDKGQVLMHVAALEAHLRANGRLPLNVKVVDRRRRRDRLAEFRGVSRARARAARLRRRRRLRYCRLRGGRAVADRLAAGPRRVGDRRLRAGERSALGLLRRPREEPDRGARRHARRAER